MSSTIKSSYDGPKIMPPRIDVIAGNTCYLEYYYSVSHPEHLFNTPPLITGEVANKVTKIIVYSCGH